MPTNRLSLLTATKRPLKDHIIPALRLLKSFIEIFRRPPKGLFTDVLVIKKVIVIPSARFHLPLGEESGTTKVSRNYLARGSIEFYVK